MFLDSHLQFMQWLEKFPDPQRFFIFLAIFLGGIGFCFLLWFIDKVIEERKEAKLSK